MADGPLTALPNLRCRTDANGYLLVTVSGGAITPTTVKTNSLTLDVANGDIVFWRTAAKSLQIDADGASGALTLVDVKGILNGSTVSSSGNLTLADASSLGANGRTRFTFPADGQLNIRNNGNTAGVGLDVSTDGTLKLMNRAQTAAANLSFLKATSYNGVTTVGQGVPSIYAVGSLAAQTTATGVTNFTPAADGDFEVSANVLVTTATTHNFTVICTYTDEGGTARSATLSFTLVAGTAIATVVTAANGTVPYQGIPIHIRAKQTTAITISTTGTFTTVNYNVRAAIRQLQ